MATNTTNVYVVNLNLININQVNFYPVSNNRRPLPAINNRNQAFLVRILTFIAQEVLNFALNFR